MDISDKLSDLSLIRLRIAAVRLALDVPLDHAELTRLADEALIAIDILIAEELSRALRASTRRPLSLFEAPEGYGGLLVVMPDDNDVLH